MKTLAAFLLAMSVALPPAFAQSIPAAPSDNPRLVRKDPPEIQPGHELRVGILRLHPNFEASVEHDDNIRLSASDEKEDMIFRETPGIMAEVRPGDHRLWAGYWAEMLQFVDVTEENAVNHLANGAAELDLGHLQVDIRDIMYDSTDRLSREDSSRDHTLLNTASMNARLHQGQWVVEGAYRNNLVDHKPVFGDDDDYDENVYTALVGHKVATKSAVFVEGDVGKVNYGSNVNNADHDYWQVLAGFGYRDYFQKYDEYEKQVERGQQVKMNAMVRLGYQKRELSDVPAGRALEDFDGFVSDSSIQYRPTPFEAISLAYLATAQVSTFQTNEWYRQDRVSFSWRKRLLKKVYIIPRFSWTHNDYPELSTVGGVTDEREDDIWQFQPELRYEPRINEATGEAWAWASLFYTFRNRDSNLDGLDFDNNKVGVKVGFTY